MKLVLLSIFCVLTLGALGQPADLGGVDRKYVWDFVAIQGNTVYNVELSASQIAVSRGFIAGNESAKKERSVLVIGGARYEGKGTGFVVVSGDVRIEIKDVQLLGEDWCVARLVSIQQKSETIAQEQVIHAKLTNIDFATVPSDRAEGVPLRQAIK